MKLLDRLKVGRLFLDGGMGSMLIAAGLPEGLPPDIWSIENPDAVRQVHLAYLEAGSDIITANTFGASRARLSAYGYSPSEVFGAAVKTAREAIERAGREAFVAADLGPTGKLLKPLGELDFEDAVSDFAESVIAARDAGADCLIIETMTDLYEMKAAVLAAKENSKLPIIASLMFDATGRLLTGGGVVEAVALLEGLGVDALGLNCGLGPEGLFSVLERLYEISSVPLVFQPNAGLPETVGGKTVYKLSPGDFASEMTRAASYARILGGCCGTTPEHIAAMVKACRELAPPETTKKERLYISSGSRSVDFSNAPVIIGERINPTGKKKLQAALREGDFAFLQREALAQESAGAMALDVNAGLPDIDEAAVLVQAVEAIQSVTALPLQLDTSNPEAMERALRRYNGKALINSVNGKTESLEAVLPLAKKYGGALICLTLDETGIPETAEGRLSIARKIIAAADSWGIPRRELVFDALTLPVSAGENNALLTLETLRRLKTELGVKTALGVSNVSFGLPRRELINTTFFTLAMEAGLDAAIINPNSQEMMGAFRAFRALTGRDERCADYIGAYAQSSSAVPVQKSAELGLTEAVIKGLGAEAASIAAGELDSGKDALGVINGGIIPALDAVGRDFESGKLFLPQLLMSAQAAKDAFAILKERLPVLEGDEKPQVLLATVKGDVHDIGKNIVKVLLESHRFRVIDLGRDVAPEAVVAAVIENKVKLVGLSALMTTTAPAMRDTVAALREAAPDCKIMVGGAVITQAFADSIGADFYGADALSATRFALAQT
jgi:5-methyltetrahydrofolate--homocysteine methyltransferase